MSGGKTTNQPSLPLAPEELCEIHDMLSRPRRWYTIYFLATSDKDPIEARTIAKQITAWQEGISPRKVDHKAYANRYNSLNQTHLSALAKYDIVEYDSDSKEVTKGPRFSLAIRILRHSQAVFVDINATSANRARP